MKAKRTYKDSLFRHMFKHKRRITHLYAALSRNHVDPRDITFRTLRGTFFNDVKNDISFLVENRMVILLEQQSTWNPNMPLRFLWYLARLYRNIVPKDVPYHSSLVSLPAPEFYVLYNGMQAERDYQVLHLSDAFLPARPSGESRLELDVPCYNINYAPGRKILEECYELRCYSIFLGKVRELSSNGIPLEEAICRAIRYCEQHDLMAEYFKENEQEVLDMVSFKWDWNRAMEVAKQDERELGRREGVAKGRLSQLCDLVKKGLLSLSLAAREAGMTEEAFKKIAML